MQPLLCQFAPKDFKEREPTEGESPPEGDVTTVNG